MTMRHATARVNSTVGMKNAVAQIGKPRHIV